MENIEADLFMELLDKKVLEYRHGNFAQDAERKANSLLNDKANNEDLLNFLKLKFLVGWYKTDSGKFIISLPYDKLDLFKKFVEVEVVEDEGEVRFSYNLLSAYTLRDTDDYIVAFTNFIRFGLKCLYINDSKDCGMIEDVISQLHSKLQNNFEIRDEKFVILRNIVEDPYVAKLLSKYYTVTGIEITLGTLSSYLNACSYSMKLVNDYFKYNLMSKATSTEMVKSLLSLDLIKEGTLFEQGYYYTLWVIGAEELEQKIRTIFESDDNCVVRDRANGMLEVRIPKRLVLSNKKRGL